MSATAMTLSELKQLACAMPKAELHLHIEGSLEPELMFALAQRNGIQLPYASVDALRQAYNFSDLQSFLDIYYAGASVLIHEQDFYDMAWAYLQGAARDNVVHTEIFFDPQTHTARGIAIGTVIRGLSRACKQAAELGVSASLILCFLRHLPQADAIATLQAALPYKDALIGVGLDSSERDFPPEQFATVFAMAKAAGLHLVAHAGEEGPPAYIVSALDVLNVERIDHGVACVQDPSLMQRLAAMRMPLTVCPLSNVRLRGVASMAAHPLLKLLEAGIVATVNSDDPAYFGGSVNRNFEAIVDALPVTRAHLKQLALNSFEASFISQAQKVQYASQVETFFSIAAV
jgi:adenine deaminase